MALRASAAVALSVFMMAAVPVYAGPAAFGLTGIQSCNQDGSNLTDSLSWSSASGAVSYSVLRGNTVIASGLTSNSYNDTAAIYGSSAYVVRAYNAAGFFTESNSVTISNSANSCINPQLASAGYCSGTSSAAHFQWNLSGNTSNFTVQRDGTDIDTIPAASRTYDDRPAPPGTHTYVFSSGGNFTLTFNGVSVPSCGSAPTAATGGTGHATCFDSRVVVELGWTPASNAILYRVYRGTTFVGTTGGDTYQDFDVPAGQYTYTVQTVNKAGTAESSGIPVTVGANVCTPPGSFTASASQVCSTGNPSVHLTWTVSSGAATYTVVRDGLPLQSGITGTSYDDPNVSAGQSRTYTVTAMNGGGNTNAPPVTINITSCVSPPPPPVLSASTFCSSNHAAVHLTWTGSSGANYTIYRNGSLFAGPMTTSTYDDATVSAQQYTYYVRASNSAGSNDSNSVTIAVPADACLPAAPSLSANATCSNGAPVVALLWSGATGASSYTILRNGASIGSQTSTSYNDSNVTRGQSYTYVVRAVNAAGTADSNSAQATVASDACITPPGSFTLNATPFCDTSSSPAVTAVRLTWTASAGATSYAILRGGSQLTTTTATTYVDRNVSGPLSYTVRATNTAGTAQASADTTVDPNICSSFTPKADISPANVSIPATASPGSSIRVSYTLLNSGTASGSSTVRIMLDSDHLLASHTSGVLAPGASVPTADTVTIPSSLDPGTYFVFVTVDNHTARSNAIAIAPATCGAMCGTLVAEAAVTNVPVVFTLAAPPCDGATVLWTFGDDSSSSSTTASHAYTAPGTYVWSVTVSGDGQSCTANGTIVITNPPPARRRPAGH